MPGSSFMAAVDMSTPQARVAQLYMDHKGLSEIRPHAVEKVDGQACWYFIYELPEGDLELEVSWEAAGGWDAAVTSFVLAQ